MGELELGEVAVTGVGSCREGCCDGAVGGGGGSRRVVSFTGRVLELLKQVADGVGEGLGGSHAVVGRCVSHVEDGARSFEVGDDGGDGFEGEEEGTEA